MLTQAMMIPQSQVMIPLKPVEDTRVNVGLFRQPPRPQNPKPAKPPKKEVILVHQFE